MFIKAIEEIQKFTRPIHSILRYYGSNDVVGGSGTFFFVNSEGVAVTCKHIAQNIINSDPLNQRYEFIKKEIAALGTKIDGKYKKQLEAIETHHGLRKENNVIQIRNMIMNSFDKITTIDCIPHPTLDLAILKFNGYSSMQYSSHATFIKDAGEAKQGKYLCRYGFPFPEFNNFAYDPATDQIDFTTTGNSATPAFPIDGIITRHLADPTAGIMGIEMSTPGLRGQSGGPLFDSNAVVYGMQYATNHLHLGFDMQNAEILSNGKKIKINNQPFLHVGWCIHAEKIKEFLAQNNIRFHVEA